MALDTTHELTTRHGTCIDTDWNKCATEIASPNNARYPEARLQISSFTASTECSCEGMGLYSICIKHRPTPPLSTQRLDADSDSEQGAEQKNLPAELVGRPITVSTLSREDCRQSDFSSPSECSESRIPGFQVITEDGDVPPKDTERKDEAIGEIPFTSSGAETLRNASLPVYCSQSCCESMIRNHRYMIAAQFLTSLQCMHIQCL